MSRFVLEPVLFSIFGELLYPHEPVEYVMPYSSVIELYELQDSDQIVTDPIENIRVKQNLQKVIAFFDQPFVKKKIEKTLKMPWSKSAPILFSESVTFTVVFSIDNAEYGESFDPVETELILLCRRENVPLITDQLELQQRLIHGKVPIQVIDVADFGFFLDEEDAGPAPLEPEEDDILHSSPMEQFEASEGALAEKERPRSNGTKLLPWIMGGFLVLLLSSLYTIFK